MGIRVLTPAVSSPLPPDESRTRSFSLCKRAPLRPGGAEGCRHGCSPRLAGETRGKVRALSAAPEGQRRRARRTANTDPPSRSDGRLQDAHPATLRDFGFQAKALLHASGVRLDPRPHNAAPQNTAHPPAGPRQPPHPQRADTMCSLSWRVPPSERPHESPPSSPSCDRSPPGAAGLYGQEADSICQSSSSAT